VGRVGYRPNGRQIQRTPKVTSQTVASDVIKVEGPRGPSSIQPRRVGKAGASGPPGAFQAELGKVTGAEADAASVEQTGGVAGVEGIFVAQAVGEDGRGPSYDERKRRAKRGHDLLDRLEQLRRGLLIGAIPKDQLAELARTMRERREAGADPQISRLLDEIELRAEVELAKLSRRLA